MYGFSAFSQSPYSTLPTDNIKLGIAQIEGIGTVTASASRERTAAASITGTAILTADGIKVLFGDANIHGQVNVIALGSMVESGVASITATATVTASSAIMELGSASIIGKVTLSAIGTTLGEGWVDTPVVINSWSALPEGSSLWTDSTIVTNDWKRKG